MGSRSEQDRAQEITQANRKLRRDQSEHPDTTDQLPRTEQGRDSVRPRPADQDPLDESEK